MCDWLKDCFLLCYHWIRIAFWYMFRTAECFVFAIVVICRLLCNEVQIFQSAQKNNILISIVFRRKSYPNDTINVIMRSCRRIVYPKIQSFRRLGYSLIARGSIDKFRRCKFQARQLHSGWLTDRLTGSAGCLGWLAACLTNWMTDCLSDCLTH